MRALVLDGQGAVGQAVAAELGRNGVTAVLAGRDPGRYEQTVRWRGDLADLHHAAGQATVVVDASGRHDRRVAERVTAAGAALVEIGDHAAYLSELAGLHTRTPILAGARLIPVLAGLLARDAVAHSPGTVSMADPVEIGVVLGAGDPENAADTGSTYALLGHFFTDPATGEEVLNFSGRQRITLPDGTRRTMARVDFPGQSRLTASLGRPVRTWFATGDALSTALLRGLTRVRGADRLPPAFHLPGTDGWQVVARAGQGPDSVTSWASGRHQLPFIAHIATIATRRAPTVEPRLHRVGDLLTLSDLAGLEGLDLGRSTLGVHQS
ncbi:hypothetical protein KIH74_34305 [Kineosporia sp. J2-2]|uniref:Saccharopine dehydrogenase n=1 Tax=Kineosporia corallincola TaxID=2835133 RepID=A0ABS5TTJ7_9ACTN|nr:hypothetical protein [Kineosporia corallincola]MBT0774069.1 hypothetical protein [Kineosporia corallincola]